MKAFGVVVGRPSRDQITGMGEISVPRFVEKLVAHPAVAAFDKAVLHRLTWRDIVPFDLGIGAPFQNGVSG